MQSEIGGGKKHMRNFAVDFTKEHTYIGGKPFPKGSFVVAILNYGKEITTRLVKLGGPCLRAMAAIETQRFTLDEFEPTAQLAFDVHRELSALEPFCYLDILEEKQLLQELFSAKTKQALADYYALALKYSGYDRIELHLSTEELKIEHTGMLIEEQIQELMRSYSYFCVDVANFANVILNFEYMKLRELEKRDESSFANAWNEFYSDRELRLALYLCQPTDRMDGFSEEAVTGTKMVVLQDDAKEERYIFAQRYSFNRIMNFLVMDFFMGLQAGHAPKQCEICKKYFLTTDGRHQRYCTGYAPNDPRHRTCQAVAARMGRKEREKAADHPVKAVCETRCNTIDHHLRSGKIDKEFAAAAKRIARNRKNRAISDNQYFLERYNEEMTQEAIYTETERTLGRPPHPQKESL